MNDWHFCICYERERETDRQTDRDRGTQTDGWQTDNWIQCICSLYYWSSVYNMFILPLTWRSNLLATREGSPQCSVIPKQVALKLCFTTPMYIKRVREKCVSRSRFSDLALPTTRVRWLLVIIECRLYREQTCYRYLGVLTTNILRRCSVNLLISPEIKLVSRWLHAAREDHWACVWYVPFLIRNDFVFQQWECLYVAIHWLIKGL